MKINTNITAGQDGKSTVIEDTNGDFWVVYPDGRKLWIGQA